MRTPISGWLARNQRTTSIPQAFSTWIFKTATSGLCAVIIAFSISPSSASAITSISAAASPQNASPESNTSIIWSMQCPGVSMIFPGIHSSLICWSVSLETRMSDWRTSKGGKVSVYSLFRRIFISANTFMSRMTYPPSRDLSFFPVNKSSTAFWWAIRIMSVSRVRSFRNPAWSSWWWVKKMYRGKDSNQSKVQVNTYEDSNSKNPWFNAKLLNFSTFF